MSPRCFKSLAVLTVATLALSGCASNIAVYESPTSGSLSTITLVNAAETQRVTLETFDDGKTCKGKRRILFDGKDGISASESRSLPVATGQVFTLFASLETIETDEYAIELGATTGAPSPVRNRSFTAIGCTARMSFDVEAGEVYQVVISEPDASRSCTVRVLDVSETGQLVPVETTQRLPLRPRGELGPYCEPLQY